MSLTLHKLNSIFVQFCIKSQWRLFWTFFLHVVHEFKRYFLRDFELPGYGSRGYFTCFLGPEYLENIFSRSIIPLGNPILILRNRSHANVPCAFRCKNKMSE